MRLIDGSRGTGRDAGHAPDRSPVHGARRAVALRAALLRLAAGLLAAVIMLGASGSPPLSSGAQAQLIDYGKLFGGQSDTTEDSGSDAGAGQESGAGSGAGSAGGGAAAPGSPPELAAYGQLGSEAREVTMLRRTTERVSIFRQRLERMLSNARHGLTRMEVRLRANAPDGQPGYFAGVALVTVILILIGRAVGALFAIYLARPLMIAAQRSFPPVGIEGKLPVLALRVLLTLAVVLIVVAVTVGLGLWLVRDHPPTQATAGIIVAAFALFIMIDTAWRMTLSPYLSDYRMLRIPDVLARRLYIWLSALTFIGIASRAYMAWMAEIGVDRELIRLNGVVFGFIALIVILALISSNRKAISAAILHGADRHEATWIAALGARVWAPLAVLYFVAAWAVEAFWLIMGQEAVMPLLASAFIILMLGLTVQAIGLYITARIFSRWRRMPASRRAAHDHEDEEAEAARKDDDAPRDSANAVDGNDARIRPGEAAPTPEPLRPREDAGEGSEREDADKEGADRPAAAAAADAEPRPDPSPGDEAWEEAARNHEPKTGGMPGEPVPPPATEDEEDERDRRPAARPASAASAPTLAQYSGDDGDADGDGDDEGGGALPYIPPRRGEEREEEEEPRHRRPGMQTFEDLARRVCSLFALGTAAYFTIVLWGGRGIFADGSFFDRSQDLIDTLLIGYIAYHAVRIWLDRRIAEEGVDDMMAEPGDEGGGASAVSRLGTLLPLFRTAILAIIIASVAVIAATELGVNVAPLFAGAGIVGIAIGFGAQTLVRDILSGMFFLLDDAFRKGEYIDVGEVKGTVEKISLRSFQLRHHLGALNTIPFGEITHLTNYSRDWVMMKLPLRLTYNTDVEKVRKLIKKLGQELLEHPTEGEKFVQPLKSQGVYMMEDSAMIFRVKYMTRPGDQWTTRKLVYQSIRDLFEKEGIRFAHREVTVRLPDLPNDRQLNDEEQRAVGAAARRAVEEETDGKQGAGGMAAAAEAR